MIGRHNYLHCAVQCMTMTGNEAARAISAFALASTTNEPNEMRNTNEPNDVKLLQSYFS